MSAVDDARKLMQDLLAPDLKALAVRVEALDAEVKLRFNSELGDVLFSLSPSGVRRAIRGERGAVDVGEQT